ncbi:MAG: guanine deaminase [Rhodobacteraceae bacterium]|nr:guanine deaminase [Paracoccaceae bacterium]
MTQVLCGQVLTYATSPFDGAPTEAVQMHESVAFRDGMIVGVGTRAEMMALDPGAQVTDYGDRLIMAGFVDAHVHYPQTAIIASWGKRLLDWLNSYTFPEEMRFGDATYAGMIAERYLDTVQANGTTSVCSYCTVHRTSVDAFMTAAQTRGMRVVAGKSTMNRNAPDGLCDTVASAEADNQALIDRWHGIDRLSYAITPRFSPTSTREQLDMLGALWSANPTCLMQTHLSEQTDEIAWVKSLFPEARDYLDTYEAHGLLGPGAIYGHAIHLEPRERDRLKETGASLVHCPTSNTFIGSGLFDMAGLMAEGQRIGLATDTGGGSSFSMLRTMAAAYEIGQLTGTPLHAAQLLWLATVGSARSLRMQDKIGNLAPGLEADLIVLDLKSTPAIAFRAERAEDLWEAIFPTIMMGDDRAVHAVWVNGVRRVARTAQ